MNVVLILSSIVFSTPSMAFQVFSLNSPYREFAEVHKDPVAGLCEHTRNTLIIFERLLTDSRAKIFIGQMDEGYRTVVKMGRKYGFGRRQKYKKSWYDSRALGRAEDKIQKNHLQLMRLVSEWAKELPKVSYYRYSSICDQRAQTPHLEVCRTFDDDLYYSAFWQRYGSSYEYGAYNTDKFEGALVSLTRFQKRVELAMNNWCGVDESTRALVTDGVL